MLIAATLWWLFFWTALGLCIGSFLNAVIYRIPRGKSLTIPLWSACPFCQGRIAWYDNLPIFSFLNLRARCRQCGAPISTRYLVIEVLMAVVVLMLLDAFLIGSVRAGLSRSEFGLTDRLSYDWPILTAHIILFACLLALSAIDLEHYWVDIRFTNFVIVAGFALHLVWTPRHSAAWPRPSDSTAIMSFGAIVGLALSGAVLARKRLVETTPTSGETTSSLTAPGPDPMEPGLLAADSLLSPSRIAGWVVLILGLALVVELFVTEARMVVLRHPLRALAPLAFIFILVFSQSIVSRESDAAIVAALEEERSTARGAVLREFLMLFPGIVLGAAGLWLAGGDEFSAKAHDFIHHSFSPGNWGLFRRWAPLEGLATAAAGLVISGAMGWAVRIVFTLIFGREAFGTGDIHMMAAAGVVAGWQVVLLGFFLTCGIALAGWVLGLPFKRNRALPLGPWLSLGFLTVVVFYDEILAWPVIARAIDTIQFFMGESRHLY